MIAALTVLLEPLWPGLAASFGLGLVVGLFSVSARPASWLGWCGMIAAVVVVVGAAVLAVGGAVAGEAGLWLDLALWLGLAYGVGSFLGTALRWAVGRLSRAAAA